MTDYDPFTDEFVEARSEAVGVATVLGWAQSLPAGGRVLDLGCGHGVPIARALAGAGLRVHGVDVSPRLLEAFRRNVPEATAKLADASTLEVPAGRFDGVVAWGLVFLLEPPLQERVLHRAAEALKPGGRLLFTAPRQAVEWVDVLTDAPAVSLGEDGYRAILSRAGVEVEGLAVDEGGNDTWFAVKSGSRARG